MPKRGKAAEFLDLFLELREFVVVHYLAPLMVSTVRLLWSRNAGGRQKFRTILDHCRQAGPGHGLHRSLSFGDSLAKREDELQHIRNVVSNPLVGILDGIAKAAPRPVQKHELNLEPETL
jgi:hypothetical protein